LLRKEPLQRIQVSTNEAPTQKSILKIKNNKIII